MSAVLALDHGTVVHDRYRILRPVGKGGMGAVYEAVDLRLQHTVAVKRMTASGAEADRAFEQEAQLLASLRHAGLPAVTDYFIEDAGRFLVMQYIEGEDLHHIRRRSGGKCGPGDVIGWAIDILDILSFLHHHDPPIVHRDVKPANIKLTPIGQIVLVDFGLAKGGQSPRTRLTAEPEPSIYGFTPNYAPPEQHAGTGTDARSDLYALGATLFHLLTGDSPPAANARVAAIASGAGDPLRASQLLDSGIDQAVIAVVIRALNLDVRERFQSADEMADALAPLRRKHREEPRGRETHDERRLDAAVPSEAAAARPLDLVVQVRFAESPPLGLEEWPSKRVPAGIEQASETFRVDYPRDPRTGQQLPARVRVRIAAADFAIEGTSECVMQVPPNAYSKRLVFLMTPRREGCCRVNIEVYSTDNLHLGTVPLETLVSPAPSTTSVWRVAHLSLSSTAREGTQLLPSRPVTADAVERHGLPRWRRFARWAALGAPLAVLLVGLVVVNRTGIMREEAPRQAVLTTSIPPAPAPGPGTPAPSILPKELSNVARSAAPTPAQSRPAAAAAQTARPPALSGGAQRPAMSAAPPPAAGAATGGEASMGPPPPPAVTAERASQDYLVAPRPVTRTAPKVVDKSDATRRVSTNRAVSDFDPAVEVLVTSVHRGGGTIRVGLEFRNANPQAIRIFLDYGRIRLVRDAGGEYAVAADAARTSPTGTFNRNVPPGSEVIHWIEFSVPDTEAGTATLTLEGSGPDGASTRFRPLSLMLPIT